MLILANGPKIPFSLGLYSMLSLSASPQKNVFSLPVSFSRESDELLEMTKRQHNALKAHQRFLKSDIPIGLLGTAATYFWFANNDRLNIVTKHFQQFVKSRDALIKTTDFLIKNANDSNTGRLLLTRGAMGNVSLLGLGANLAESPKRLQDIFQRILIENPSSSHAQSLMSNLRNYKTAYLKITSNSNALKTLMISKITKLLRMTPYQAKQLAQNNPAELMKQLFKQVYGSNVGRSPTFFNTIFSELGRANVIRARMAGFGALVLFLGTFITRMELGMNNAFNPQEAF